MEADMVEPAGQTEYNGVGSKEALKKDRYSAFGSFDASKETDSFDLERQCSHLNMKLQEKEFTVRSLKEAHERLQASHKLEREKLRQEQDEIIKALEASELKCEEQCTRLREVERSLTKYKAQSASMEKKFCEAENKTNDASLMVKELQEKLDETTTELFELKNATSQVDSLRVRLQECERALSRERSQRSTAESSLTELTNRAAEWTDMERTCNDLNVRLRQKDLTIENLKEAHERLQSSSKMERERLRQEHEDVVKALEACELRCEEQCSRMHELEFSLSTFKSQSAVMEKKCSEAATTASEASTIVSELQLKLDETTTELFELKNSTSQVGSLRQRLQECEKSLSEEKTLRTIAESALEELKHRDDHLEEVEQAENRLKWRNEQFQALEEAHSRLHEGLKSSKSEWEAEKSCILSSIDSLTSSLDAKERMLVQAQSQLMMVHQALAHEQSRCKALEAEAQAASLELKQITTDGEAAQSAAQVLRERMSSEIGSLRDAFGAKDREFKDLQIQFMHMEQEYKELKAMDEEYRNCTLLNADLQKQVADMKERCQNAQRIQNKLRVTEEKRKELEDYLGAAKVIAQEKDEKLAASEWAVQQLALDVTKAKNALHLKEREEAVLRERLEDLERQLRGKEGELIEAECHIEEAVKARKSMGREVEALYKRMEELDRGAVEWKRKESDMTSQLEVIGTALEEKRDALAASELIVKQGNDQRQVMEGAIVSLKSQLQEERKALTAQGNDMNRLCEDLERSKEAAKLSDDLVKDLRGRLQQMEQSSEDRLTKYQGTLEELQQELSAAHVQLEKYQRQTCTLKEELSHFREKCQSLLDLTCRKEQAIEGLESQFTSAQSTVEKQGVLLEKREKELLLATEKVLHYGERESCWQESLSRLQAQVEELQASNKIVQALEEERKNKLLICRLEEELRLEKEKVNEFQGLFSSLQELADERERKVEAAARDGEVLRFKLSEADKSVNELKMHVEGSRLKEQSLTEEVKALRMDLTSTEEELTARKGKLRSVFLQLEKYQKTERDVIGPLRSQLAQDIQKSGWKSGGAIEVDGSRSYSQSEKDQLTENILTGRDEKVDDLRLALGEAEASADELTEPTPSEVFEELVMLRHHADESQLEIQRLTSRLDTALSNVATKNAIITQMQEEISGVRTVVKDLELERSVRQGNAPTDQGSSEISAGVHPTARCTVTSKSTTEEDYARYLELCDSLVRKNIQLEKQLEGSQRKNRGLQKQVEALQSNDKALSADKHRRPLEEMLSPEAECSSSHGKSNRKGSLSGRILGERDENTCITNGDKVPLSTGRRPCFQPGSGAAEEGKASG